MLGQLIGGEYELPQWLGVTGCHLVAIEDVHGQRTVDLDRISSLLFVKVDSAAESSNPWFTRLMEHGIGPDRQHDLWYPRI